MVNEYVPAGQSVQDVLEPEPVATENLPMSQLWQSDSSLAPSTWRYFPATHGTHVRFESAPTVEEYLPISHGTQTEDDVAATMNEYVPAAQLLH